MIIFYRSGDFIAGGKESLRRMILIAAKYNAYVGTARVLKMCIWAGFLQAKA